MANKVQLISAPCSKPHCLTMATFPITFKGLPLCNDCQKAKKTALILALTEKNTLSDQSTEKTSPTSVERNNSYERSNTSEKSSTERDYSGNPFGLTGASTRHALYSVERVVNTQELPDDTILFKNSGRQNPCPVRATLYDTPENESTEHSIESPPVKLILTNSAIDTTDFYGTEAATNVLKAFIKEYNTLQSRDQRAISGFLGRKFNTRNGFTGKKSKNFGK